MINIGHSRSEEQTSTMERIKEDGVCPFCPGNMDKYHTKPIIIQGKYWLATENFEPYEGAKYHFLLICHKHHDSMTKTEPAEQLDLFKIIKQLQSKYEFEDYSLLIRNGDTNFTGASVEHLHAHLIVGKTGDPNNKSIKIKIGYGDEPR